MKAEGEERGKGFRMLVALVSECKDGASTFEERPLFLKYNPVLSTKCAMVFSLESKAFLAAFEGWERVNQFEARRTKEPARFNDITAGGTLAGIEKF